MSKIRKICSLALWSALTVSQVGCIYYKTITVPVNQLSLEQYQTKKDLWTVRDINHRTDAVYGLNIRNDSIYGRITPGFMMDHPDGGKTYSGRKGSNSSDYFHLYTNVDEYHNEVRIPISDVTSATTHKKATGKIVFVNSALLVLAIIML